MEDTASIVRVIVNENPTASEIHRVIGILEMAEDISIPYSLVLDYLRIKSSETQIETVRYKDKKIEIDKIISEYTQYLTNMQELQKNKEISIVDKLNILIEKSVNSCYITREDKIYLGNEQSKVKRSLNYQFSIDSILIYITISLLGRIEILKIEKNILELSQDAEEEMKNSTNSEKRKMSVYKLNSSTHPIRITGRTTHKDLKDLLTPTNSPTMSIEQYGERMMRLIEEQSGQQVVRDEPQDELKSETEIEETRQKDEKDKDYHYGDGNRMGRN